MPSHRPSRLRLPVDFLVTASNTTLEEVELSRLNLAANLRKQLNEVLDAMLLELIDANIARLILENDRLRGTAYPFQESFDFSGGYIEDRTERREAHIPQSFRRKTADAA